MFKFVKPKIYRAGQQYNLIAVLRQISLSTRSKGDHEQRDAHDGAVAWIRVSAKSRDQLSENTGARMMSVDLMHLRDVNHRISTAGPRASTALV